MSVKTLFKTINYRHLAKKTAITALVNIGANAINTRDIKLKRLRQKYFDECKAERFSVYLLKYTSPCVASGRKIRRLLRG